MTIQSLGENGASVTNYDPFLDAITTVRNTNVEPNAVVYAPRTAGSLSKLKDQNDNPLTVPKDLADLSKYTTTAIATNIVQGTANDTSEAFLARWSDLLVGIRTEFRVEVLREREADRFQYGFLGFLRADVALAKPDSFVVITGIRP